VKTLVSPFTCERVSGDPRISCLPAAIDHSELIDVTCIGDSFRKYVDRTTGKLHDSAEYYPKHLEYMKGLEND
jgi:hypothetical protein